MASESLDDFVKRRTISADDLGTGLPADHDLPSTSIASPAQLQRMQ